MTDNLDPEAPKRGKWKHLFAWMRDQEDINRELIRRIEALEARPHITFTPMTPGQVSIASQSPTVTTPTEFSRCPNCGAYQTFGHECVR